MPRSFGSSVYGTSLNNFVHFDYIEIASSRTAEKYVFMLSEDHRDYNRFFLFFNTAADCAAQAIMDWRAAFGVPKMLMSDGPTHFKNETVRVVCRDPKVLHNLRFYILLGAMAPSSDLERNYIVSSDPSV